MIWIICCINVLTIVVAFKKRMVLYGVLNAIFLYLVTGQAFQIKADLEISHSINYLLNFISDAGFNLALWYVFGISAMSLALALVSRGWKNDQSRKHYSFSPGRWFYVSLFLFLCFLSIILIFVVVGLSEFLHSSRPGFQSGSTIFLVLLFLGMVPLLLKILHRNRIGFGDIACCLVCVGISGVFSRIHLIFYLIAILLALYYARGWANAPFTPKLLAVFFGFGIAAALIIAGIGAIHDAQNFVGGSFGDIVSFIIDNPDKSIISIQYNYRVGIEGMSGIAGAFTQYLRDPVSVHRDYGASWILQGTIQWLPGFLKPYFDGISDLSNNLIWYPYSVIATAAETFFMSFGWLAIFLYPIAVYLIAWILPSYAQRFRSSPSAELISYIIMAWSISFVRGPLAGWIAFCFSYSLVTLLFWPMFFRHFKTLDTI